MLRLDQGWLRWSHQLNFLQHVEHLMDDEHREVYAQTLDVFLSKLKTVTDILGRLVEHQVTSSAGDESRLSSKRVRYALKKNSLDKAIEELETWQRTADHSWFLLMKIASPRLDAAMESDREAMAATIPSAFAIRAGLQDEGVSNAPHRGITFNPDELSKMAITQIPFSELRIGQRTDNGSSYVLNAINLPQVLKYHIAKKDTRNLVRKLQHNEPQTFGLLSCKGFVVHQTQSGDEPEAAFTMILRTPPFSTKPRSLRDILLNAPSPASLSVRFELARELAKAASYVHSFGFVHKNIRPETILTFEDTRTGKPTSYLAGFENFRHEDGCTRRKGDDAFGKNLYRHPNRQGTNPRNDYVMQHDIYSLGVCLLEVGLWRSFVQYCPVSDQGLPSPFLGLPAEVTSAGQAVTFCMMAGKEHLVSLARSQLLQCMGSRYAEVVVTCLTCLDPGNVDFGDAGEFEDEDGVRVGARYIEKVRMSRPGVNNFVSAYGWL